MFQRVTQPVELLRIPLAQLQPKPSILTRLFRKWQKHEVHSLGELFPQGDALYELFPLLCRKVSSPYAECITDCTEQWTAIGYPAQVKQWKSQNSNVQGVDVLHSCPSQSVWKISFRWWLQDNEVVLVVFFVAPAAILETFASAEPLLYELFAPYYVDANAPIGLSDFLNLLHS